MNKSQFNKKYHQGIFIPKNKEKYVGLRPTYRSSWEYHMMLYLDLNDSVIKWSSETIIVPYKDLEGKMHRYYPDFYYQIKNSSNPALIENVLVEIKPAKELLPPIKPLNETTKGLTNYEYAIRTYMKNKLKWEASVNYCNQRGWKFVLITEDHLKKYGIMK